MSVLAARRAEDDAVTVLVTNLYLEDKTVQLDINANLDNVIEARLLAPEILAESVPVENLLDGTTLSMPAQSVVLLVIASE